jgi:hypothetical protein
VNVTKPDAFETFGLGGGEAVLGCFARCGWQVRHKKVAVKTEKSVRDVWVQVGYERCYGCNLLGINIAGDKKGAGNERRRVWSFGYTLGGGSEVFQSAGVADSTPQSARWTFGFTALKSNFTQPPLSRDKSIISFKRSGPIEPFVSQQMRNILSRFCLRANLEAANA